jgi:3-hydroxyisobutyrate dehydrogenase-like beta-hydroxyacid dehydrogenase
MSHQGRTVGLLHPGWMGAAVGRQAAKAARVLWLPAGRSAATADRAKAAGLHPARDLATLVHEAEVVISLCPPQFADQVAGAVLAAGFHDGVFLEANAIGPERMAAISEMFGGSRVRLVDGSVIGPPPPEPATTRLYLAGAAEDTSVVVDLFAGSDLEAVPISTRVGAASALKTAQAVFQKTSRALAGLAHALADHYGIADVLTEEGLRRNRPVLAEPDYLPSVAARAWRWAPEMTEAAATLRAAGLPDTMVRGAGEVFDAWSGCRDAAPDQLDVLFARLRQIPENPAEER